MKNPFNDLSNRIYCGFAITLSLCFLIACDSDDTPSQESLLPPITMTGENTFGCLIDGKFFRPRDGNTSINIANRGLRVLRSETNNIEFESHDFKTNVARTFIIHVEDLLLSGEGIYEVNTSNGLRSLDGNNNSYIHCTTKSPLTDEQAFYTSYDNSGNIYIEELLLDSVNGNIISGTFNAKLTNILNPQDTVLINKGRFDINSITILQTTFN